jgi:hypothetical protein
MEFSRLINCLKSWKNGLKNSRRKRLKYENQAFSSKISWSTNSCQETISSVQMSVVRWFPKYLTHHMSSHARESSSASLHKSLNLTERILSGTIKGSKSPNKTSSNWWKTLRCRNRHRSSILSILNVESCTNCRLARFHSCHIRAT